MLSSLFLKACKQKLVKASSVFLCETVSSSYIDCSQPAANTYSQYLLWSRPSARREIHGYRGMV